MKSILHFLTFSILLLGFLAPSHAQDKKGIQEAAIKYTITGEGSMASMITGSTLEVFFTANNAKLVASGMGGAIQLDARFDNKKSKSIVLMDMMGQKKVLELNDLDKQAKKEVNETPSKIEYIKKYKKIAGYKCQQVKMTVEGMKNAIIIYITEQIAPANFANVDIAQFGGFKGFPLSWEFEEDGVSVKMEATSVSLDKLSKSIFELVIPEGYEKMDLEDLGGMGSSFGL